LISAEEILQSVKLHAYTPPKQAKVQPTQQAIVPYRAPVTPVSNGSAKVSGRVAEVVFWKAVEVAAERLILALL
jgi:hypothetical protein